MSAKKKDTVSVIFWSAASLVAVSFGMAIYTAIVHPEKEGPELIKPTDDQSIPVPATPE